VIVADFVISFEPAPKISFYQITSRNRGNFLFFLFFWRSRIFVYGEGGLRYWVSTRLVVCARWALRSVFFPLTSPKLGIVNSSWYSFSWFAFV
jgi:hypothetical protein